MTGTFVAQNNRAKSYGRFTIDATGAWTYTLDDRNADVQALNAGEVLHDMVTVAMTGGATRVIDITVKGANDAAVISGTATGSVTEKSGVVNGTAGIATATGDLNATDVDNAATFVVQSSLAKSYGTFSIDDTGGWSYTLNDSKAAVQALNSGDVLHDLVTVKTADGTAKVIDITIKGVNDAAVVTGTATGSVTEKSGVANGTAGVATANGNLNATDVDSAGTFVAQGNLAKSYGTFSIDDTGAWTYTLDDSNAAVRALNSGGVLHDLVTVKTADGTAKVIDISIKGANDAAVITGTATDTVREKGGVANGTAGVATASGNLNATDVDSAATFVVQTNLAKSYGTFSIDASGLWSYTLDDGKSAVQALNVGGSLHEFVTVKTADGTSKVVDVTIQGANDAAVITGTATDTVREKGGVANGTVGVAAAGGNLNATDVDSAATFVAQTNLAKSYGTFSIDATGLWTYTLNDAKAAVQALNVGDTLHELMTVKTADGTSKVVDVTIQGANDAAVISGTATGSTTEKGGIANGTAGVATATGDLEATDVDNPATFVAQANLAKSYGTFSIDETGAWTYTLNDANADVEALGAGDTLHDLVTVATADGTTRQIDITINGASDSGFDLTDLAPALGFVIQGAAEGDRTGRSVSSAGDVNGDGFADLIVGAPYGGNYAGDAYVVFGKASGFGTVDGAGRAVLELATLSPTGGFVVRSDVGYDFAGWSVSAGDVNGDGFADLIVGALSNGTDGAGNSYVVFGHASGFGTVDGTGRAVLDLPTLSGAAGFIVQGDAVRDNAGWSVSSAGDVNGDGFADLIVGAKYGDDGGSNAGEAYVVLGKASGFGTVDGTGRSVLDLTALSPADGFIVQGDAASDQAGFSVSSAGDVNGDGFADLIVGAPFGTDGGSNAGEAYVVFGRASGFGTVDGTGRSVLDLTTLSESDGFIVQGDGADDLAGFSVSSAGDVNGDGFADLIVGARLGDDGGSNAGEAYVVFGKASGFGTVDGTGRSVLDLTTLSPTDGFIVQGDAPDDQAGWSVSSAGDVNGDGFADLIVGARRGDDGGSNAGEAYVVFGKASGFGTVDGTGRSVLDLMTLLPADGFIVLGDAADDEAGYSVTSAGDVNGDGFADLIVGSPFGDDGGSNAGEAYVLFGGAFGGSNEPVTTTGTSAAEILIGGAGDDTLSGGGGGDSIRGGAGDDMLSVGDLAFRGVDGGGGSDTLGLAGSDLTLDLSSRTQAAKIAGIEAIDLTGTGDNTLTLDRLAVLNEAGASDDGVHVLKVDGNAGDTVSFIDVQWANAGTIVEGTTTYDRYVDGDAEVRIAQGVTVSFPARFDLTFLQPSQGFIIQGDTAPDEAGFSVSSAGDVNGDGFADLIVGARNGDAGGPYAGEAYVVFGKAAGFGTTVSDRSVLDLSTLSPADGFIVQGDAAYDEAGWSVSSAGDVNGDGFPDLIVGAPLGNDGGPDAGEAYVVFGKASAFGTVDGTGRSVLDLSTLSPADGFIVQGDAVSDWAGISVSSAGDVNGDGFADLIVGSYSGDGGGYNSGEAYVVFGKASGFGAVGATGRAVMDLTSLSPTAGFIVQGDAADDRAGASVSSAGDLNGDGFDDLIVGAKNGDDGGSEAGEAYVVFGKTSGFGTVDGTGRSVIDLTGLVPTDGFIVQGDAAGDQAGFSVSAAGDVNGDGFADLIVGAATGDDGGSNAGEAYVIFGKASGFGTTDGTGRSVLDLTTLSPADGFIIQGDTASDFSSWSVSSAGDVNGDGFADLIVGAPIGSDGGFSAGEAYVVFGKASGFGTVDGTGRAVIDLTGLAPADGFIVQGDTAGDSAGWSVSSAGDVNGDGFADLMVGARLGDDGGNSAGEVYVLFGGAFGGSNQPVNTTGTGAAEILIGGAGDDTLTGGGGADVIRGGAGDDTLTVPDLTFRSVDGGGGFDTLVLLGSGQNFDLATLADDKISNVERVDITGSGDNTLTLGFADILAINDGSALAFTVAGSSRFLVVEGNAGDTVALQDYDPDGAGGLAAALWVQVAAGVGLDGSPGAYNLFDLVRGSDVLGVVAMDSDITRI